MPPDRERFARQNERAHAAIRQAHGQRGARRSQQLSSGDMSWRIYAIVNIKKRSDGGILSLFVSGHLKRIKN
jgi:hypothetical protein